MYLEFRFGFCGIVHERVLHGTVNQSLFYIVQNLMSLRHPKKKKMKMKKKTEIKVLQKRDSKDINPPSPYFYQQNGP